MKISLIAAMGNNRELGYKGRIPWHLPEELQHFKKITMGHHLLMGRKTFELVGSLPGRAVIVLGSRFDKNPKGCLTARSVQEAVDLAKDNKESELFVCGGGQVYRHFLPLADFIYLSHVDYSVTSDTWFPQLKDEEWETLRHEIHHETATCPVAWRFELLRKYKT